MRLGTVTRSTSKGINHKRVYPYILTVIDMQEKFRTAHNPDTVKNVELLVKKAIEDKAYIIVAQYRKAGQTLESIKVLISSYRSHSYAIADKNDKSSSIHRKLLVRGLNDIPRMYVCGVNLDACVFDTVYGLRQKYHGTIYIVKNACNSNDPLWANTYLKKMSALKAVIVKDMK